jgi:hypothetical protein
LGFESPARTSFLAGGVLEDTGERCLIALLTLPRRLTLAVVVGFRLGCAW